MTTCGVGGGRISAPSFRNQTYFNVHVGDGVLPKGAPDVDADHLMWKNSLHPRYDEIVAI